MMENLVLYLKHSRIVQYKHSTNRTISNWKSCSYLPKEWNSRFLSARLAWVTCTHQQRKLALSVDRNTRALCTQVDAKQRNDNCNNSNKTHLLSDALVGIVHEGKQVPHCTQARDRCLVGGYVRAYKH